MQIDIVARSPRPESTLTLIEVKTRTSYDLAHLSIRQARRLAAAAAVLAQEEPIEILLAFVEHEKVQLLPVDALTDF